MNTLVKVLSEKLRMLGYTENVSNAVIQKIDIALIEKNLNDVKDYSKNIEVYQYDQPSVEINRTFLNINNKFIQTEILEGEIKAIPVENAFKTRFVAAEYQLNKRCALISVTNDFKIKINIYAPTQRTQALYDGKTYEDVYKKERDVVTLEYKEAFERNKRLEERKIEEILNVLVSDYIIDEMIVDNLNPRLKMYEDPKKYAENITAYSLRFINDRTNRIEIFEREPEIRRVGSEVIPGTINNDPYIRLSEMPIETNFMLNKVSYYWLKNNGKGQEEIAIYIASKESEYTTYSEMRRNTPEINAVVEETIKQLKKIEKIEDGYVGYIGEIIKSLNIELVVPSVDVIREGIENFSDLIMPITYRYRFTTDPTEFEEKLYVSIEDNIGKNYKYKISESILEDLTRIGNKLEYTDEKGEIVKRQSIADFNVNAPSAIIRKETFIDENRIPDLLGYIYEDMESFGTEKLPIPSIYVDIYIPKTAIAKVSMYNGTSLEFTLDEMKDDSMFFNNLQSNEYISNDETMPGSTYVTVKYVNSKNEVLKENKIGNQFPNTTFVPEILPIINDISGKEWRAEIARLEPFVIKEDSEQNIIIIKYVERYTRVSFSFINREGKKIADDKQEIVQVGSTYDFENKKRFTAKDNEEWTLKFARPAKFIAKDDEEKNKVILVYDIERADVVIKYIAKSSLKELKENSVHTVQANKNYLVDVPKYIVDADNLGWNYIEGTETNIMVKPDIENEVSLYYTEAKVPVTISYKDEKGNKLLDDKVEFVQIGKKYNYNFDEEISDFSLREWKLKKEERNTEIIVNKEKNIIEGIYEPILTSITVKFLNKDNRTIKNDKIERAQIGEIFNVESFDEITDNFGKAWKHISSDERIVVKEKESENQIALKYEPLMSKVTVKYLDTEMNELMESKYEMLQVGTEYKTKPIEKFASKDGKRWKIDCEKVENIIVKKYEEENIYEIYYDKEVTKVKLEFFDIYDNKLKKAENIEAQIGSELEIKLFERIIDDKGERFALEASEPKNLIVKEKNNLVKLIYGEVKSNVLIKYIDVKSGKAIIDDTLTKVRLGGIYIPNIQNKILDKNKYRWKYIGDENISIVTKENEQENIIVLNYEEDKSKIILKYTNEEGQKIREDAVKDVQIGKEIKLEPIQKFVCNNGLSWKYKSLKMESSIVEEKDNIIYMTYEPVIANVVINYVGADPVSDHQEHESNNIIEPKTIKMQAGKEFVPEIIDRITDEEGKVWVYNNISEEKIIIKEEQNEISMSFEKLIKNVSIHLINEEGNLIDEPIIYKKQVGEEFTIPYEKTYQDKEGKAWLLAKVEKEVIVTSENEEKNIVKVWYEKELVDVKTRYFNDAAESIRDDTIEKVQIGSIYISNPFKEIIDEKTKLGWKLPDEFVLEHKVKRNNEENILNLNYEKLNVNISVRYKDTKDAEITEETIYKAQVGTTFTPKVEQVIIDNEEKEWLYGEVEETKLFAGVRNKVESIVVSRDEKVNYIDLIYRPSLVKVTIRYQEALGNLIKQDKEVDAQIGSIYEAEIIEVLQDDKKIKWVYNPNSNSKIKVGHEEKENVIILAYEEEKALVTYKYQDEYGNRLRQPKRTLVQIGTMYRPEVENVIEDYQGKVWEYKAKSIEKIEIKDDESSNVIEVIYVPLKVDVIIQFVNVHGKQITKEKIVKAQLGSEFVPELGEKITDEDSKLFKIVKCEPEKIKIQEIPIGALESPNKFELTYEPVFSDVTITYKTIDGKKIKNDDVTQMQVGTIFEPPIAEYAKDEKGIEWELISKDIDSIRVKEDSRENIISMVYEVAKTEVTIRYKDVLGNNIYKSEIIPIEVGKEYIPEIKNEIIDDNNKKWIFAMAEPVKLTVGSINNIINLTYQEKKATVIIKYQTKDGKTLKEDVKAKVQIGTRYEPQSTAKVIYEENEIWRFSKNEPSEIVVSENTSENVIIQVYTKDDKKEEKNVENKTYYNPEIEKFIDKNLIEDEQNCDSRGAEDCTHYGRHNNNTNY